MHTATCWQRADHFWGQNKIFVHSVYSKHTTDAWQYVLSISIIWFHPNTEPMSMQYINILDCSLQHTRLCEISGINTKKKQANKQRLNQRKVSNKDLRLSVSYRGIFPLSSPASLQFVLYKRWHRLPRGRTNPDLFYRNKGIKLKCSYWVSRVHKYAPMGQQHLLCSALFRSTASLSARRNT